MRIPLEALKPDFIDFCIFILCIDSKYLDEDEKSRIIRNGARKEFAKYNVSEDWLTTFVRDIKCTRIERAKEGEIKPIRVHLN